MARDKTPGWSTYQSFCKATDWMEPDIKCHADYWDDFLTKYMNKYNLKDISDERYDKLKASYDKDYSDEYDEYLLTLTPENLDEISEVA